MRALCTISFEQLDFSAQLIIAQPLNPALSSRPAGPASAPASSRRRASRRTDGFALHESLPVQAP